MATLSSPGIGSGLDVNGIVNQLMALERRPLQQLEQQRTRFQTQLSAFGRLQSAVSALRDAARKLTNPSTWSATTVASSNPAVVSASVSGTAPPGSYAVSVTRLAAAQTLSTPPAVPPTFATAEAGVGSGTLTIELGRWSDGDATFTPKPGASAVTVTIEPGNDSLAAVRDAINAAGAGVTASIVSDAHGARLALRSTTTGADNAFRIGVADDDGNDADDAGLSRLAYDPSSGVARLERNLAATNAEATINGVAISSPTNMLDDVLDGLNVKLSQVTTAPVELGVERDNASIKKAITDFASAYNDLVKLLREQTAYDDAAKKAGALQGDRSAVGLLNQLRTLIGGSSGASSVFTRLADVGLEPQRDGTLSVVTGRLDGAVGRLDELRRFFSRDEEGTASDGFGVLLRAFGDGALASDGVLTSRQDGLQLRLARNRDSIERFESRLVLVEKRLREQYTKLDTNIAGLTNLQNYVSQQIHSWNRDTR